MSRFDIARLRKEHKMSQGALANHLQITQSFLSAIENGKSPLPPEKIGRLCEIFNLDSLDNYVFGVKDEKHKETVAGMTDSDLFNQLLNRFHRQAHSSDDEHHHHHHHQKIEALEQKVEDLFARNDRLMHRNDQLAAANDSLREENDRLRHENDLLRAEIFNLKIK